MTKSEDRDKTWMDALHQKYSTYAPSRDKSKIADCATLKPEDAVDILYFWASHRRVSADNDTVLSDYLRKPTVELTSEGGLKVMIPWKLHPAQLEVYGGGSWSCGKQREWAVGFHALHMESLYAIWQKDDRVQDLPELLENLAWDSRRARLARASSSSRALSARPFTAATRRCCQESLRGRCWSFRLTVLIV